MPIAFRRHTSLPNTDFRLRLCAGPIPTELGQLTAMYTLELNTNQLTGGFLCAHCISMVHEVPNTDFRLRLCPGLIPTELGQLTAMDFLNLAENKLTGTFLRAHCNSTESTPKLRRYCNAYLPGACFVVYHRHGCVQAVHGKASSTVRRCVNTAAD